MIMKKEENKINGLNERHVSQIIRRKMITRVCKDKTKYYRTDKSWKKDVN